MAVAALLLLASTAAALKNQPYLPHLSDDFTISRLESSRVPGPLTDLRVTDNVVNLRRVNSVSLSSTYVQALIRQARGVEVTSGSANLIYAEGGQVFLAPVSAGGQAFYVVVDTGSSDPWLVTSGFDCYDLYGNSQDPSLCYFGPTYNSNQSSTYNPLPNENFNISYADGESLTGTMGYDSFTMAGINVPHQEFALVNQAAWIGDGISSGLVGFASSVLTSAYPGTNPDADKAGTQKFYNPLYVNMYTNESMPPLFSLAISRDPDPNGPDGGDGGVLALGGIPDIPHSASFTSTPIISVGVNLTTGDKVYEFYSISIGGWAYSAQGVNAQYDIAGTGNPKKVPLVQGTFYYPQDGQGDIPGPTAIIDSGTSLVYTPNNVAAGINALFDPAAYYDSDAGTYYVDCDATAPTWGVVIANKTYFANPVDMIVQSNATSCISGVQPNFDSMTILGDVWMKSILCVFDIGAEMMRFSAREFDDMSDTSQAPST